MGKNIILADCEQEEIKTFAAGVNTGAEKFDIECAIANGKRKGVCSELKRYAKYFAVGIHTFLFRKRYGTILGWQQFFVLIYGFCCEIFKVKKENTALALNYTYKDKHGFPGRIYKWFMGKCTSAKYIDYIHVPSNQYADQISREFQFPRERIIVTHFGVNDCFEEFSGLPVPEGFQKDAYALAIGRSNRDYDFLVEAWQGIDYPLVIISDTYKMRTRYENITVLTDVVGEDSHPWIAHCGLMILPLKDGSVCSGDTVLLTSMAAARKIIVTKPSTLAEMYIEDGENALLAEKNAEMFRALVVRVVQNDAYSDLGFKARKSYLQRFSRQSMGEEIAKVLHQRCNINFGE